MANKATAEDVAAWMLQQVRRHGELSQEDAVDRIESKFGANFVYDNERGNPAIGRDVLAAFRKVSVESVVWIRTERIWRKREKDDDPGRQQEI